MNLKELLALKKKKIKKKIVLLSCKGGIGDKNSVAKIMAKKCQCVVYASSYPYGLSYRYDKKKKVYYPRYGGKRNYYNHENPLKKYKPLCIFLLKLHKKAWIYQLSGYSLN